MRWLRRGFRRAVTLASCGALLLGASLAGTPARAAPTPPTLTVTAVASPTDIGNHTEAYGYLEGPPGTAYSVTGALAWDGDAAGTLLPLAGTIPGTGRAYLQLQSAAPLAYQAGMQDGDLVTLVVTPAGASPVTVSWTVEGVQAPDPGWSLSLPEASSDGWLPPLGDNPSGGTVAAEQVLVTRTASTLGTVTVGGSSTFVETPTYFDQTWAYAQQQITLAAGASETLTLKSAGGIEPVYPGHTLAQEFHLSTGQVVDAQLPVVAEPAGAPTVVSVVSSSLVQHVGGLSTVTATDGWLSAAAVGAGTVTVAEPVWTSAGILLPVSLEGSFSGFTLTACGHLGSAVLWDGAVAPGASYNAATGCLSATVTAATTPAVAAFVGRAWTVGEPLSP